MKTDDFTEIDLEAMTEHPTKGGYYELIPSHWWSINVNGKGLLYRKHSRQCNRNKSIAEFGINSETHPAVAVKFYPAIWFPINPNDFKE